MILPRMLILAIISFLLNPNSIHADAEHVPQEINGFRLGTPIEDYEFIHNRNFLEEIIIEDIGAFRKGVISYGTCDKPGKIIKIKLKYKDQSRNFFDELLKHYKKKFGKPDKFTGDAFGIVLEWKWHFTDKDKNYITMSLQHNMKNIDENIGNMVKLSLPNRITAERACFNKRLKQAKDEGPASMLGKGWNNLIPR